MNDFCARAMSLVDRIESDRSDPGLAAELEALRVVMAVAFSDERERRPTRRARWPKPGARHAKACTAR